MLQELLERSNVTSIVGTKTSKPSTPNGLSPNATPPPSHSSPTPTDNLRCPRCDSSNTKFCYYNNYNLTQPRHFCRACRRYWTKGGALRNVPIGGACRKNKHSAINTAKFKTSQTSNLLSVNSGLNGRALVSDSLGLLQFPSIGLSDSFYTNQGIEVENINGVQELYERLMRSSTASCYGDEHAPLFLGNMSYATTTTTSCYSSSGILESAPASSGLWNPSSSALSWPIDLPTAFGEHTSQL